MAEKTAPELCSICNRPSQSLCVHCMTARYCSQTCQRYDGPVHKLLCRAFSRFRAESRPSPDHFRAIVFPMLDEKPKFVWLRCETFGGYLCPITHPFLESDACIETIHIDENIFLRRDLPNTIMMSYNGAGQDESRRNKCLQALDLTIKVPWGRDRRGSEVAYGIVGRAPGAASCRDLDMTDFRHIIEYHLTNGRVSEMCPWDPTCLIAQPRVRGVRINCAGDQMLLGSPHYESVGVPPSDPIFHPNPFRGTSGITDRIGIPIFIWRLPPDPSWRPAQCAEDYDNTDVACLAMGCDPNIEPGNIYATEIGWSTSPHVWLKTVGSVLMVRQDMKPLLPLHAEALCMYCGFHVSPLLSRTLRMRGQRAPEHPLTKEQALAMISRQGFLKFWPRFLEDKRDKGEDCDAPDPYEFVGDHV